MWLAAFAGVLALLVMGRAIRVAAAPDPATSSADASAPASLRIDVNKADPDELRLLPGVGGILAERIVAHRERHGPFTAAQDLEAVPGVGEVTRQRLSPWITTHLADP
ncbi:MAG: ComEA family DNA-binding protein [Phycisphaeraceae bacterium]